MATPLEFVGGDEVIEPFLIEKTDGTIQDLTGTDLSGVVSWRGRNPLTLSAGSELLVTTMAPPRAVGAAAQIPHGYFRLTEPQTDDIPPGNIAKLKLTVVEGGVTMSTYGYPLKRVSQTDEIPSAEAGQVITLRLVHSIPGSFQPVFGGEAAGIGVIQGTLSASVSLAGTAAGVGAGEGVLTLFFPSLDFSDVRNGQYLGLSEDI